MTVNGFIRTFKDLEVDIKNDENKGLIEIIIPKIDYIFYRFNYEQISNMSGETAFFIAYGLFKTLILLETERWNKWVNGLLN